MAITAQKAREYAKGFAVSSCKCEAGTIIEPNNLEDPDIFNDLESYGFIKIPENCYKIEQVLGKRLIKKIEALTPITDKYVDLSQDTKGKILNGTFIKVHIEEGKNIDLEIPVLFNGQIDENTKINLFNNEGSIKNSQYEKTYEEPNEGLELYEESIQADEIYEDDIEDDVEEILNTINIEEEKIFKQPKFKVIRSFKRKYFKINKVVFSNKTIIDGTTLYIRDPNDICSEVCKIDDLASNVEIDIIYPGEHNRFLENIIDIEPIATKEDGEVGVGITRIISGTVCVLTVNGENINKSSKEKFKQNDIVIKIDITLKSNTKVEKSNVLSFHQILDYFTDEIRKALKNADISLVEKEEEFYQARRSHNKRVVIIKQINNKGIIGDILILPKEPAGIFGAKSRVDLGSIPIILSPTEVLDGGIHALNCNEFFNKECSIHYFKEPLVSLALDDEQIDLVGVIFVGTSEIQQDKIYISKRLGMMVEAMDVDGAIISSIDFENTHIDFYSHIEQITSRGIKTVGLIYDSNQGKLVIGSERMNFDGNEDDYKKFEILDNNQLCTEDANRTLIALKTIMNL